MLDRARSGHQDDPSAADGDPTNRDDARLAACSRHTREARRLFEDVVDSGDMLGRRGVETVGLDGDAVVGSFEPARVGPSATDRLLRARDGCGVETT